MKILHVVHGYPPNIGGTQLLFQEVSERLVRDYDDSVTVFTTNAHSNYHFWQADNRAMPAGTDVMNGVTIRRFPVFNRFSWLRLNLARVMYKFRLPYHDWARALYNGPLVPGLATAVAKADADIVAAASFPLLHMHTALRGARRSHKPITLFGALHPEDRWGFDRAMIYQAISKANGYLAATAFEKTYLSQRGISAEKITVTGAGVDTQALEQANGDPFRQQYQLADVPVIAFIGQQAAHKGIGTLLAAMPDVWQTISSAVLVIAGRPTAYSTELKQQIAALPPERRSQVLLLNALETAVKNDLLAACDVLALPSRHESFGMVFIEAWICGKPVIGADIGAVASLVDAGENGLLVPPGDAPALAQAIIQLLQNPALQSKMGAAGRHKAITQYSWEAVVGRFRQAYLQAIAQAQE